MRTTLSVVIAVLILVVRSSAANMQWQPTIIAKANENTRSLIVTVGNVLQLPGLVSVKVCVSIDRIHCIGEDNIQKIESPADFLRYNVNGLTCNSSYYIFILPMDGNGNQMDTWIRMKDSINLPPCSERSTTTTEPTTTSKAIDVVATTIVSPTPGGVAQSTVYILIAVFLFCVLFLIAGFFFLWRKRYDFVLSIFPCCVNDSSLERPRIDVLSLWVVENPPYLESLINRHLMFLQNYANIHHTDLLAEFREQQRNNPHMDRDQLFQQVISDKRVLIYVSPLLVRQIRQAGGGSRGGGGGFRGADEVNGIAGGIGDATMPLHKVLRSLATPTEARGKSKKPLFIFSGCYSSDSSDYKYLSQHPDYGRFHKYWISKRKQLVAPGPLLKKMSGCQHRVVHDRSSWQRNGQLVHEAVSQLCFALNFDPTNPNNPVVLEPEIRVRTGARNTDPDTELESVSILSQFDDFQRPTDEPAVFPHRGLDGSGASEDGDGVEREVTGRGEMRDMEEEGEEERDSRSQGSGDSGSGGRTANPIPLPPPLPLTNSNKPSRTYPRGLDSGISSSALNSDREKRERDEREEEAERTPMLLTFPFPPDSIRDTDTESLVMSEAMWKVNVESGWQSGNSYKGLNPTKHPNFKFH